MPPVVSPAASNMAPNMMPHVNVFDIEQKNVTENIYMYPYAKPKPVYNDTAIILVLFILLVIISRGVGFIGKC
jgi:hypothetical protein